ncbi:MAG: 16S rRNA (cytosine(1402)-N(4))-methyltransferase RsmH [Lachnospiraceae bacterium]|nr:16S rRNA (cytosine(1402)-N(4))-methyltransferase RsmH [Lachnospiraceae bacterium]
MGESLDKFTECSPDNLSESNPASSLKTEAFSHIPVLLKEVIEGLHIKKSGIYIDGTAGGGGHSSEIAKRLDGEKGGRLIALDQDAAAVKAAGKRLEPYSSYCKVVRSNFSNYKAVLDSLEIDRVDGILLDLGVSSYQLDTAERGFSYMEDAPLDMRMDDRSSLTACYVVNHYTEMELYRIIRDYGEDRFAKNIAKHICAARARGEIKTTGELEEIVRNAIPARVRKTGGHPAKRTFQAIRIEVNQELTVLEQVLDGMIDILNPGGRFAVITFHSLEDRIVKEHFRKNENPCICPPNFPVCVCGRQSKGKVLTRKAICPTEGELTLNKRAKSAKLRIFERV